MLPVTTSAKSVLDIMTHRLSMAEQGITFPQPHVIACTRQLVESVSSLSPDEAIEIVVFGAASARKAQWIVFKTRQVLAELALDDVSGV